MTQHLQLRVALVGTGAQAIGHLLPCLRSCSNIEVSYVISRTLARAKAASDAWGIRRYGDSWEAMLDDADCPDAIVAAVNPELHQSLAAAALERGKSIFVEKPPATSLKELESLCVIESHASAAVFVGYNFAFGAQYRKAIELAQDHGGVAVADYRFVSSKPVVPGDYNSLPTRLVWDTFIHPANLATRALGSIESTNAQLIEVKSGAFSILVTTIHQNGAVSRIEVGNYLNRFHFEARLLTHDGTTVEIDGLKDIEVSYGVEHAVDTKATALYRYPIRRDGAMITGYMPALQEFIKYATIRARSTSTFADSIATYELLEEVLKQLKA